MILSDSQIIKEIDAGNIIINPFDRKHLGSNSYDVHLADTLLVYQGGKILDPHKENPVEPIYLEPGGLVLAPGELYLGSTRETTYTKKHAPMLEGRSSIGRLGINIHATAGVGDVGFCGYWTLEITVVRPVKVYPGMKIGQVLFYNVQGEVLRPYDTKPGAKYNLQGSLPQPSKYHLDVK